ASSPMVICPKRAPRAAGVKLTLMVQLPTGATDVPQSLLCEKSPLTSRLEILSVAPWLLVSTVSWGPLVVPTCCVAKSRLVFERVTGERGPVHAGKLKEAMWVRQFLLQELWRYSLVYQMVQSSIGS